MLDSLVDEFGDRIYRFVCRLVGREWADDLCQETFLKALKSFSGFRGGRRDAWLFSIANRVCIDFLRRRGTESEKLHEVARDTAAPPDPIEHRIRDEDRARALQLVRDLPREQQQVLLLHEEGRMTFLEIAEAIGSPLGTVLTRMRAALAKLKQNPLVKERAHDVP
ncbi:MAG TPA: RNA polymerase sigma factor [Planctomycetota bacterium]|nr:RNA polymerase sigma factor [Planctomycetota bacterium]